MVEIKANITDDIFKKYYLGWNGEIDPTTATKLTVKYPVSKTLMHQYLKYLDAGIASNKTRFMTILMCYGYDILSNLIPEGIRNVPTLKTINHSGAYTGDVSTMIGYENLTMPSRIFSLRFGNITNSEVRSDRKTYYQLGQVKDMLGDFTDILGFSTRHGHAPHFLMMLALKDCHFVADFEEVKKQFDYVLDPTIASIKRLFEE